MLPFTIITEFGRPVAIILDADPEPGRLTTLFSLLPGNSFDHPDLAKRWNVPKVIGSIEWATEQRRRHPMIRPSGSRMAILALLVSAFCLLHSAFAGPPTASSGAADLIQKSSKPPIQQSIAPPLPSVVVAPPTINVWYFQLFSIPTNCGPTFIYWTNNSPSATLTWSIPTGSCQTNTPTNNLSGYEIQWGADPASASNTIFLQTTVSNQFPTNLTIHLIPPPLTNLLVTVTTTAATNLQWSPDLAGPWTLLGATNWTATNPPAPRYFRALGRSSATKARAMISSTQF